jgi:hypothetical protein
MVLWSMRVKIGVTRGSKQSKGRRKIVVLMEKEGGKGMKGMKIVVREL